MFWAKIFGWIKNISRQKWIVNSKISSLNSFAYFIRWISKSINESSKLIKKSMMFFIYHYKNKTLQKRNKS